MKNNKKLRRIEELEYKYLDKYYHFLKFVETEMLFGFKTKDKIRKDWEQFYNVGQDFAVGAERIVYALLNGKGIGQPNSNPVSSDLFFEVEDAYIHIDMKTVITDNIGDFNTSIFVGENQNSYRSKMIVSGKNVREYKPNLPTFYQKGTKDEKVCLTYFITILSDPKTLDVMLISLMCMPNGELEKVYGPDVLKAGKNPGKARFNFCKVPFFKLLGNGEDHLRIKIIYFNENMSEDIKDQLGFYYDIYTGNYYK